MKKAIVILFTLLISYSSCKKIDKLTNFYINYTETYTLGAFLDADSNFELNAYTIGNDLNELYKTNNTNQGSIKKITLDSFAIIIKSPDTTTFDFAQSVNIYITSKGLDKKKIAWTDGILKNGLQEIELQVSDDDIQNYINSYDYVLINQLIIDSKINYKLVVDIDYTYLVTANLSN